MVHRVCRTSVPIVIGSKQQGRLPFTVVKATNIIVVLGLVYVILKFLNSCHWQASQSKVNVIRLAATDNFARIKNRKEVFRYRGFLFKGRYVVFTNIRLATVIVIATAGKQHKTQIRANTASISDIVSNRNRRKRTTRIMPINIFSRDNSSHKLACRLFT